MILRIAALALMASVACGPAAAGSAEDPGRKACLIDARRLCPAEMRSMSRKRVEACMIARIEQTSPLCHAAMLRIKAGQDADKQAAHR